MGLPVHGGAPCQTEGAPSLLLTKHAPTPPAMLLCTGLKLWQLQLNQDL